MKPRLTKKVAEALDLAADMLVADAESMNSDDERMPRMTRAIEYLRALTKWHRERVHDQQRDTK
jgi:hypothetical protein